MASLPVQRVWPADVLGWAGRERGLGLVVSRSEAGPPCAHESRAAGTRGELWRWFRSAEPGHRLQSLQEAAGTLPLEPRHGRRQPRRSASQGRAWVSEHSVGMSVHAEARRVPKRLTAGERTPALRAQVKDAARDLDAARETLAPQWWGHVAVRPPRRRAGPRRTRRSRSADPTERGGSAAEREGRGQGSELGVGGTVARTHPDPREEVMTGASLGHWGPHRPTRMWRGIQEGWRQDGAGQCSRGRAEHVPVQRETHICRPWKPPDSQTGKPQRSPHHNTS